MKKPENVTINSITFNDNLKSIHVGMSRYEPHLFAIGSDDKIYVWIKELGNWYLYANYH